MFSFTKFFRPGARPTATRRSSAPLYFRPTVESLEDRTVMSVAMTALPPLAPVLAAPLATVHHQLATPIVPITVNSITATANQLLANASIGGTNFQIPLTLEVPTGQAATSATQILNLHLAPIHLNVLGLTVDTSEICLNITAQPGPGNLLGNLLSGVAHSLDQGLSLSQILGQIGSDVNTLTTGLTGLLNGALGQLTTTANAAAGAAVTTAGSTNILHLAVGPLNLNLLGLQVNLDNCHGGPVTVDVGAQAGPGNLLGNLLGGLSHLLDGNANLQAISNSLNRIANEIGAIL